jgi:hypothetical protein
MDKNPTRKNNRGISAMDYMFISPDLQHKDPMRNTFTESIKIDMNNQTPGSRECLVPGI